MTGRPLVLYHGGCQDGFCAAWSAWRSFGDRADYLPVFHGTEPPDVTGRPVYLLDFSYPRAVMVRMLAEAMSVTVLDHHKTAQAALDGLENEFVPRPDAFSPTVVFDMHKSGGRLAWEHFRPDHSRPAPGSWLVDYTEDRDLWRWALPHSKEINAWLATVPRDFDAWNLLDNPGCKEEDDRVMEGAAILRYQAAQVEKHAANAVEIELGGHKVLAVNATSLASEIGERLAEGRAFGATYFLRADGRKVWSLRSRAGGVDVSEIARAHGGGGHRNAAGFEE